MPHKGAGLASGSGAKTEAKVEMALPVNPLAEPPAEPPALTALAVKSEESETPQPTHHKFNVVLCNFEAPRLQGQRAYFANMLHLPCMIGLICEC